MRSLVLGLFAILGLVEASWGQSNVIHHYPVVPRNYWVSSSNYYKLAPPPYLAGGPIYTYHVVPYPPRYPAPPMYVQPVAPRP